MQVLFYHFISACNVHSKLLVLQLVLVFSYFCQLWITSFATLKSLSLTISTHTCNTERVLQAYAVWTDPESYMSNVHTFTS